MYDNPPLEEAVNSGIILSGSLGVLVYLELWGYPSAMIGTKAKTILLYYADKLQAAGTQ